MSIDPYSTFAEEAREGLGNIPASNPNWNSEETDKYEKFLKIKDYAGQLTEALETLKTTIDEHQCVTEDSTACNRNDLCYWESGSCHKNSLDRLNTIKNDREAKSVCAADKKRANADYPTEASACTGRLEDECSKDDFCEWTNGACMFMEADWWLQRTAPCVAARNEIARDYKHDLNTLTEAQNALEGDIGKSISDSKIRTNIQTWTQEASAYKSDIDQEMDDRVAKELAAEMEAINACKTEWLNSCHYNVQENCTGHCEWTNSGCTIGDSYETVWNTFTMEDRKAMVEKCAYDTSTMSMPDLSSIFTGTVEENLE